MKKILLLFLFVFVGLSSWANEKMCADSTGVWGSPGFFCPKPNNPPVSYYIDDDTSIVHISTSSLQQIKIQIIGQVTGLVAEELFYGHTSIMLLNHDFFEIVFYLLSGEILVDYFLY